MTMPLYVSPEQFIQDRGDYALQGIHRGKPVIVAQAREGLVLATPNASRSLSKLSEIYDRIGWAAVGRYSEFEALRQSGIRWADTRGYAYHRSDVTGRAVATMYSRAMGEMFLSGSKPLEVEIIIAEVGATVDEDLIYKVGFDGTLSEHPSVQVIGGRAEELRAQLTHELADAPPPSVHGLIHTLVTVLETEVSQLELAVLDRQPQETRGTHRAFRRILQRDSYGQ